MCLVSMLLPVYYILEEHCVTWQLCSDEAAVNSHTNLASTSHLELHSGCIILLSKIAAAEVSVQSQIFCRGDPAPLGQDDCQIFILE